MARILVIDDDDLLRRFVVALLEKRKYDVQSADSGEAGLRLAAATEFDLVVTDIVMPGTPGLETISEIRRQWPEIKILAISGGGSSKGDYLQYASRLGANAVLAKPFEPTEFLDIVARLAVRG